jgi:tetratricopeptide (TPR) repeat protein
MGITTLGNRTARVVVLAVLLILVPANSVRARETQAPDITPVMADPDGPGADLFLSPEVEARSEALSHYAVGVMLQLQREPMEQVTGAYARALEHLPNSPALLQAALSPHLLKRDFSAVASLLEPVVLQHPDATNAQLAYCEALVADERPEQAIAHLQSLVLENPKPQPVLVRQLFVEYWRQEDLDGVAGLLDHCREIPDLRGLLMVSQAEAMYWNALAEQGEHTDREKARLRRRSLEAARTAATQVEAGTSLADLDIILSLLADLEAWSDALALLGRASQLGEIPIPFRIRQAEFLLEAEQTAEAVPLLIELSRVQSLPPQAALHLVGLLARITEFRRAALVAERVVAAGHDSPAVRFTLGQLYAALRDPEACLDAVAPLTPTPELLFLRSRSYLLLRDYPQALALLDDAGRLADEAGVEGFLTPDILLYRATVLDEMGRVDEALADAEAAAVAGAEDAVVWNFVGYVLADNNRELERAESLVRQALAEDPLNTAYLDSLAWVHFRQERFREARVLISRCLALDHDAPDAVILDHAGDILHACGYRRLATAYWKRALQLDPYVPGAEEIQLKLGDR